MCHPYQVWSILQHQTCIQILRQSLNSTGRASLPPVLAADDCSAKSLPGRASLCHSCGQCNTAAEGGPAAEQPNGCTPRGFWSTKQHCWITTGVRHYVNIACCTCRVEAPSMSVATVGFDGHPICSCQTFQPVINTKDHMQQIRHTADITVEWVLVSITTSFSMIACNKLFEIRHACIMN